ncbi:MAG: hypothetical protein ACLRMZ_27245 [Blautia marasmi]
MPYSKNMLNAKVHPACITASFAFIAFYNGYAMSEDGLTAKRAANEYTVKDDKAVLEFYLHIKMIPQRILFMQSAPILPSGAKI